MNAPKNPLATVEHQLFEMMPEQGVTGIEILQMAMRLAEAEHEAFKDSLSVQVDETVLTAFREIKRAIIRLTSAQQMNGEGL